jgi:hypothetical protein
MTNLTFAFHNFANAPKNYNEWSQNFNSCNIKIGRSRCSWKVNIKMCLTEIGRESTDCFELIRRGASGELL